LTEVFHAYARPLDRVLRRGFTLKRTGLRIPALERRAERADVTQETFTRAFDPEVPRAYDATHDYLPFLVGIARNVMASQHRRWVDVTRSLAKRAGRALADAGAGRVRRRLGRAGSCTQRSGYSDVRRASRYEQTSMHAPTSTLGSDVRQTYEASSA